MESKNLPTIRELLDLAPARFPDRVFIRYLHDGEVVDRTYAEVRSDALAVCRRLRRTLPANAHVAIMSRSTYAYIVWLTGLLIGGFVAIPLAPELSPADASAILRDADAAVLLHEPEIGAKADELRALCPSLTKAIEISDEGLDAIRAEYGDGSPYAALSDVAVDPEACQLIIYTSGTTGEQKGVMLSGRALVANVNVEAFDDVANRSDVLLSALPLYHIFCFVSDYIFPLQNGNMICLNGDMRYLFKNLLRFRPQQMRVVPTLAAALLARINGVRQRHPEWTPEQAAANVTGGNLKILFSGGAYLDPALCRGFEEYGIFLRQGYGMSEAGCKITVPDRQTALESVGRLMNICEARTAPDGELQILTPCRMLGYYKRPDLTAEAFTEDGWLRTGDLGYVTEDRQVFITGRAKNLIILANGENVSPEGIERRYLADPLVSEVLVYAENGAITAEIYPNPDARCDDPEAALWKLTDDMNRTAAPSHTVAKLKVRTSPFEKTATGKLIRPKQTL